MLERTARIKELGAHKIRIQESIQIQIDQDHVTRETYPLAEYIMCNFLAVEINVLLKWKLGNNGAGNKIVLLDQYFEAPEHPPIIV